MSKTIADRLDESHPDTWGRLARELYLMAETMKPGEAQTRALVRAKDCEDKAGKPAKYKARRKKTGQSE